MSEAWRRVAGRLERHGALGFAKDVAAKHRVALEDLLGRRKYGSLARARAELIAVVTWTLGFSQPEAGEVFGYSDHTTAGYHCRKHERRLREEHRYHPALADGQ